MLNKRQFSEIVHVVEEAGILAGEYFNSSNTQNEQKDDGSVVTEIDKSIEKIIRDYVHTNFPDDTLVGEEGGAIHGSSGYTWWIDPIDGTDNFIRRIPFTAISVARLGEIPEDSFGIVHNPITKQTFSSFMDNGVYENDNLHEINDQNFGGRTIIATGRGKEPWMKGADYNLRGALANKFGKGAAYGSCALELAYVAANRIDGFFIMGLTPYDYAAGMYLVRASGGLISYYGDGEWKRYESSIKKLCELDHKYLFASYPGIHEETLEFIKNPEDWPKS